MNWPANGVSPFLSRPIAGPSPYLRRRLSIWTAFVRSTRGNLRWPSAAPAVASASPNLDALRKSGLKGASKKSLGKCKALVPKAQLGGEGLSHTQAVDALLYNNRAVLISGSNGLSHATASAPHIPKMARNTGGLGCAIPLLMLLFPLTVVPQEPPKVEVFGGYSCLALTEQSRTSLKAASLSGWNASVKLNVTPRLGLLADFAGNYGQRGLTPYTINSLTTPGELMRVEAVPGDMGQHTFLFGPEVRFLRRDRLSVNVRALIGVAHTNMLVLPLREPIQRPTGSPITERTFPSASMFAAAFGGSLDYRITNRLSYRIVQPEILLTRMGSAASENWNQYTFRLSTAVVFTSGEPSFGQSSGRHFSVGVIGGAALTDAFGHESTGFIIGPNGGIQPMVSRSYSTLKDYAIGPTLEVGLPWRNLAVEIDALYRPLNLTMAGINPDGSLNSISPATVITWELPALAKYRFGSRSLKPFIEAGPSFRVSGNLNGASPSVYGGTAGIGIEANLRKLRIGPVVRYTHWSADPDFTSSRTKRNQVELLVGLSF